jgi:peptide chain release factor 1
MFDKLRQIEDRYRELNHSLSNPAVIAQPAVYARTAKAAAELAETVQKFDDYKAVLARLSEARHIWNEDADREMRELAQAEIDELGPRQATLEEELRALLIPRDPNDEKNVFLEIRAGAGGDEAGLFAADLVRMYTKYAERQKWRVEVIDAHPTGIGGLKEAVLLMQGRGAWSRLKFERGVHRVQRVPATESSGRITPPRSRWLYSPRPKRSTSRSTTGTSRWTSAPRGRAARGSTPRTRRCVSRICPRGSS